MCLPGSYHNRCHLLVAVTRSLGHLPPLGLSLGDYHGLLQLLVPDLPLAAVKNAWSTAVALQEGVQWGGRDGGVGSRYRSSMPFRMP
jgi:hypothetical protein